MRKTFLALALSLPFAGLAHADLPRPRPITPLPQVLPKPAPITARAAFERLKSLAGEWTGHIMAKDGPPGTVVYRVASNGNAVEETLFPGGDHEMVTMYFIDGEELRAKHFCGIGNQPEWKLDRGKSTADVLEFVFTGGTNMTPKDPHVHGGRIRIVGDKLENEWEYFEGGQKKGGHLFFLERKAAKAQPAPSAK